MMRTIIYLTSFILLMFMAPAALAKTGEWSSADQIRARLISSIETIGSQKSFDVLLEKKLSPGWHSYWRSPGEAGLAPTFDWSGSDNVQDVEVFFPAPSRIDELGLTTFGYSDEVDFPVRVTLKEPGKPAKLDVKMDTLVCMQICIPQHLEMTLDIESGDGAQSQMASLIERRWNDVPKEERKGLKIENVVAGPNGMVVTAFAKDGFDQADLFVELPDYALLAAPRIEPASEGEVQRARLIVAPLEEGDFVKSLMGKEVRITLTDGREAVEKLIQY